MKLVSFNHVFHLIIQHLFLHVVIDVVQNRCYVSQHVSAKYFIASAGILLLLYDLLCFSHRTIQKVHPGSNTFRRI